MDVPSGCLHQRPCHATFARDPHQRGPRMRIPHLRGRWECGFRIFAARAADSASDMRKPHRANRTKIGLLAIRALDANGRPIAMSLIMLRQSTEPTNPAQCAGPPKELVS